MYKFSMFDCLEHVEEMKKEYILEGKAENDVEKQLLSFLKENLTSD